MLLVFLLGTPAPGEMIAASAPFPEWKLVDHTGKRVSSAELEGKTYLLWYYPKAMTPGCTAEGNALRDQYADFRSRGIEVLGVSLDSPADNARFVAEQDFPFRLLSDEDAALAVRVGAADSTKASYTRRISYLIGPDGVVLRAYATVDPAAHAAQVLGDFDATSTR